MTTSPCRVGGTSIVFEGKAHPSTAARELGFRLGCATVPGWAAGGKHKKLPGKERKL